MIVIDTSALVAILNHEPERTTFFEAAQPGWSAIRVSRMPQCLGLRAAPSGYGRRLSDDEVEVSSLRLGADRIIRYPRWLPA
jgi:uncharacterized protein with PIN domain